MNKLKLTIFDKYIFKQVLMATLVCLFLFIIVWIAPETLVRTIKRILIEHMPLIDATKLLLYEIPKVLAKAIPVGILLGSLFTFDTLSKNSELSIFRGVGLSFNRIMAPVLVLGVILAYFCYVVNDKFIPYTSAKAGEAGGYDVHFVYIIKDNDNKPKQGLIVSNFSVREIKNLILLNFSPNRYADAQMFNSIIFAPYALKLPDKWLLKDAKQYSINPKGIYQEIKEVGDYPILNEKLSDEVFQLMKNATRRDRSYTNKELGEYVKLLKKQEYTDEHNFMLTKYYQRFLHPLTCVIFAAIGCLLGFSPPRSQRLVGFTIGVGMIFAYYITLPFFDLLAQKGVLFPFLAAAFPIIVFVAAIFVIKKARDL